LVLATGRELQALGGGDLVVEGKKEEERKSRGRGELSSLRLSLEFEKKKAK